MDGAHPPPSPPSFAPPARVPTVQGAWTEVPIASEGAWRPTFTQGILLGQASMVLLAVLFLKYVVFENPETAQTGSTGRRKKRGSARSKDFGEKHSDKRDGGQGQRSTRSAASTPHPSAAALLASLSYDLSSHPSESLDWLNILLAQLLASYRTLAVQHLSGGARALIEEALNRKTGGGEGDQGLVGVDYVEVEEVELGEAFPTLSAARVRPSGGAGESVRVELDIDYADSVSLAVSTRVVMNFPRPRFAILPVSLGLSLERFSGTLTVELPPPSFPPAAPPNPSPDETGHEHHPHPSVHLSLHPDFDLALRTSSLLGSRAKLQDVPKIEHLLSARIRAAIQDRVVWPGRVEIALPGLTRTKHAHRGADGPLDAGANVQGGSAPSTPSNDLHPLFLNDPPFSSPTSLQPPLFRRSDTGSSSHTPDTPSVDLSAPEGPSIALHPHLRRPSDVAPTSRVQVTPSPTESLPGYFPSNIAGVGRRNGQAALAAARRGSGETSMRYRRPAAGGAGLARAGLTS